MVESHYIPAFHFKLRFSQEGCSPFCPFFCVLENDLNLKMGTSCENAFSTENTALYNGAVPHTE